MHAGNNTKRFLEDIHTSNWTLTIKLWEWNYNKKRWKLCLYLEKYSLYEERFKNTLTVAPGAVSVRDLCPSKGKRSYLQRGINGLWVRNGSHFWCDTWEPEARGGPMLSQWWSFGRGLTVYRVASTGFSCFILLRTGTTGWATKSLVSPSSLQYTPSRLLICTILFAI